MFLVVVRSSRFRGFSGTWHSLVVKDFSISSRNEYLRFALYNESAFRKGRLNLQANARDGMWPQDAPPLGWNFCRTESCNRIVGHASVLRKARQIKNAVRWPTKRNRTLNNPSTDCVFSSNNPVSASRQVNELNRPWSNAKGRSLLRVRVTVSTCRKFFTLKFPLLQTCIQKMIGDRGDSRL